MGQSSSTPTTVTGVNEIPPPQFDANANAPPQKQHDRVIDFVRVSPESIISHKGVGRAVYHWRGAEKNWSGIGWK
jgi:hypothetical protein